MAHTSAALARGVDLIQLGSSLVHVGGAWVLFVEVTAAMGDRAGQRILIQISCVLLILPFQRYIKFKLS